MFYCIEYLMVDFPIRAMQRERDVDKYPALKILKFICKVILSIPSNFT